MKSMEKIRSKKYGVPRTAAQYIKKSPLAKSEVKIKFKSDDESFTISRMMTRIHRKKLT